MAMARVSLQDLKDAAGRRWLVEHLDDLVRIVGGGYYWRPNGRGYTAHADEAGVQTLEDAYAWTRHCGPEKGIKYELCAA